MNPFSALAEKPWTRGRAEEVPAWGRLPRPTAAVGLAVFLAVVTVLFSLLAAAYLMRMAAPDWRPLPEPRLLWANTLVLALGGAALHGAGVEARRGRTGAARLAFLAGGLAALAFLAGQLAAWRQLAGLGHLAASNPADTFFYLLTALHGLHLLGGLAAWGLTAARLRREPEAPSTRLAVRLCAAYWHFLLLLWVALFGLLLADGVGALTPMRMHH